MLLPSPYNNPLLTFPIQVPLVGLIPGPVWLLATAFCFTVFEVRLLGSSRRRNLGKHVQNLCPTFVTSSTPDHYNELGSSNVISNFMITPQQININLWKGRYVRFVFQKHRREIWPCPCITLFLTHTQKVCSQNKLIH